MEKQEQTLSERIAEIIRINSKATIDYVLRGGKLPKKWPYIADLIISLILAEVNKAALKPEQLAELHRVAATRQQVAAAQLEAIKKQLSREVCQSPTSQMPPVRGGQN